MHRRRLSFLLLVVVPAVLLPAKAAAVRLALFDSADKEIGELARGQVRQVRHGMQFKES